jgi:hypothetical protein
VILRKIYQTMAAEVVESLREERLDLDRFLPAMHREMLSCVKSISEGADDYESDDLNWAANQEREARLFLDGLTDAIAELEVADRYAVPSTDAITLGHIKAARATLRNLKRRMESL